MIFIDYPKFQPLSAYENVIAKMVDTIKKKADIVSIFQLGSIGQPGISDIDLLVVFKESTSFSDDPRATLSKNEKYLISHGLYGLSEAHIREANKFGFFFHPKLLWGKELLSQSVALPDKNGMKILKIQIALEFLLKMYINTVVEQTYGIIKLRALLLQAKALLMDLDLLESQACQLHEMLQEIVDWRKIWFDSPPMKSKIIAWLCEYQKELPFILNDLFQKHPFYLRSNGKMSIGKNIEIINSRELFATHRGITFPWIGFLGRRYFNLLHRVNRFNIYFPYQIKQIPEIVIENQKYFTANKTWLAEHAKHFMPLSSSLMSSIVN